jgi:hypothetical protein
MSARAPTIKKQADRITIANKERTPDIAMDIIWENERGTLLFNRPTFTKKALLPTDPPAFSDLKQNYVVDIRFFQCPPNWLWVSDWILDMNGLVDEQGWSYNDTFTGPSDSWTNSTVGRRVSIVRRRKWTRMRRLKSDSSPAKLTQTDLESDMKGIEEVISLVQQKRIDRERLQAIKQYLAIESNSIITSNMVSTAQKY